MRFASSAFLHLLWLLPVALALLVWSARQRRQSLERLGDPALIAKLTETVSPARRRLKIALLLAACVLLILAIARPQIGAHAVPVKNEGIDLVFVLDTSLSMLAEDIKPNRLERAKHEMSALMDKLRGDRVGLVIFSGVSFIQCPLTFDYGAAKLFLDAVDTNSISVPGTALESALHTALKAFEHSPPEASKVIIVLTDGESHEGEPLNAAEAAAEQGVKIYTIGIGSQQGEPIPMHNEQGEFIGYKKDRAGEVIMTKLDQLTLEKISMLADGQFYRVSSGGIELDEIYADIARMEKTLQETRLVTHYEEQYQYCVALALLLIFIETFLTDRKQVRKVWQGRFR